VDKTADLACRILSKGYPLLTEKPPGLNAGENRRMVEAAGVTPNFVAFNRRYMPVVQKAMSLLNEWGGPECIMDIHYRMIRGNRRDANFATTAIHGVDLVRYIVGSAYRKLDLIYNPLPRYGESAANFHLRGHTENGIFISLDFLPLSGIQTERLEINTHKGLLALHLPIWAGCYDGLGRLALFTGDKEVLTFTGEADGELTGMEEARSEYVLGGFYHENAAFFDALRNDTGSKRRLFADGDIASGLQAVEIADCLAQRLPCFGR
jgi:predicted dehydrogenase